VSAISQSGCSTSVALATGPTDKEEEDELKNVGGDIKIVRVQCE